MIATLKIEIRVVGDRIVARANGVDAILGSLVRCPCCGRVVDFRRPPCPT